MKPPAVVRSELIEQFHTWADRTTSPSADSREDIDEIKTFAQLAFLEGATLGMQYAAINIHELAKHINEHE